MSADCSFSFVSQSTMSIRWNRPSARISDSDFRQELIIVDETPGLVGGNTTTKAISKASDVSYNHPVQIGHTYLVSYLWYSNNDVSNQVVTGKYSGSNPATNYGLASTFPQPPVLDGSASLAGIDASGNAFITIGMSFPNDGYADLTRTFIKITDSSNAVTKQAIVNAIPKQITKATANSAGVYEKFLITYDSSNVFPDMSLNKGTEYDIAVDVANTNGSSSQLGVASNVITLTPTTAVGQPTHITATSSKNTDTTPFVNLAWSPPNGTIPTGYNIYRSTLGNDISDNSTLLSYNTKGFSYKDESSLKIGKTYYYQLSSINADGQSSHLTRDISVNVTASLPAATGLKVIEAADGSFNLTWNAITDASSGAGTYTVGYDKGTGETVHLISNDPSSNGAVLSSIVFSKSGNQYEAIVGGSNGKMFLSKQTYTFTVYGNISATKFGATADSLPATASVTYYTPPAGFTNDNQAEIYSSDSKTIDISFNSQATTSKPITDFLIYGVQRPDISNNDIIDGTKDTSGNLLLTIAAFPEKYSYYTRHTLPSNGTWSFAIIPSNKGYTNPIVLDSKNSYKGVKVQEPPAKSNASRATVAWDLSNLQFSFNITDPTDATPLGYYVGLVSDKDGNDLSNIAQSPPVALTKSSGNVYTCASGAVQNLFTTKTVRSLSFRVDASYASGYSSGIRTDCTAYKRKDVSYNSNITAEVGVKDSVTFDWSPLIYDASFTSIVTGYKLDISHNDDSVGTSISLGNVTRHTASLVNGTIYKARITPVLTNYEANAISPIPINVNTLDVSRNTVVFKPYSVTGEVTSLVAKYNDISGRMVDLSWNAPATSTGITCASFNIYVDGKIVPNTSNGLTNKLYDTASSNVSRVTVAKDAFDVSLNNATKYTFGVICVDASLQEVGTMRTVDFSPLEPLPALKGISGVSTNGTITLYWSQTTIPTGYSNVQYNIYQTKVGTGLSSRILVATVTSKSHTITTDFATSQPLVSGTAYSYAINATASTINNDSRTTDDFASPAIKCNSSAPVVSELIAQSVSKSGSANVDGIASSDSDVVRISWINPSSQLFDDFSFNKYLVKFNNVDISNNSYIVGGASSVLATQSTNMVEITYSSLATLMGTTGEFDKSYPVSVQIITDASAGGVIKDTSVVLSRALVLASKGGLTFTSKLNASGKYETLVNLKVNVNGSAITNGIVMVTPEKFVNGDTLTTTLGTTTDVKFFNATGDLVANGTTGAYDRNNTSLMFAQIKFTTTNEVKSTPLYVVANANGMISNLV